MSEKDVVLTPSYRVPDGSAISNKPSHLLVIEDENEMVRLFISIELPDMKNVSCIQAKGFFTGSSEEEVKAHFSELIAKEDKKNFVEIYVPWVRVVVIQNLVFRAK
jgi:hypothetical protein